MAPVIAFCECSQCAGKPGYLAVLDSTSDGAILHRADPAYQDLAGDELGAYLRARRPVYWPEGKYLVHVVQVDYRRLWEDLGFWIYLDVRSMITVGEYE